MIRSSGCPGPATPGCIAQLIEQPLAEHVLRRYAFEAQDAIQFSSRFALLYAVRSATYVGVLLVPGRHCPAAPLVRQALSVNPALSMRLVLPRAFAHTAGADWLECIRLGADVRISE